MNQSGNFNSGVVIVSVVVVGGVELIISLNHWGNARLVVVRVVELVKGRVSGKVVVLVVLLVVDVVPTVVVVDVVPTVVVVVLTTESSSYGGSTV